MPRVQWTLSAVPSFPASVPLLFLYGNCEDGTGCPGCPPCAPRTSRFFGPKWLEWVDGRAGSAARGIGGAGHWMALEASNETNAAMDAWLRRRELPKPRHAPSRVTLPDAPNPMDGWLLREHGAGRPFGASTRVVATNFT